MANLKNLSQFIFNLKFKAFPEQQGSPKLQGKLQKFSKVFTKYSFPETEDLLVSPIKYRVWPLSVLFFVRAFASLKKQNKTDSFKFKKNPSFKFKKNPSVLVCHLTYT